MKKRILIGLILIALLTGGIFILTQKKTAPFTISQSAKTEILKSEKKKRSTQTRQKIEKTDRNVRMIFFGDMMLGRHVRTLMDKNGAQSIFSKIREGNTYFDGYEDLVIANLEGPIVSNPIYHESGTTFGFTPDTAKIIKENKIDIVGIANNHTLDRGQKGLEETQKYLKEAGVEFFGHPILPTEKDILIKKIRGRSFAFIGFHDATRKLDEKAAAALIKKFDSAGDDIIIYIHWGTEYARNPNQRQQTLAHLFIDNGADLIIGHHPHWVQTRENYKGVEIFYSLGNFIFDQYWSEETQKGLAVAVEWPVSKLTSAKNSNENISSENFSAPKFEEMPLTLYKSVPQWK